METFREAKDQSSHFLESQPFRFWYVEIHHQRKLKSTKTGISSSFQTLARPETKNLVYILWEKVYITKICSVKARSFCFKNCYFPLSAYCSQLSVSHRYLVAFIWSSGWDVTSEAQLNQLNLTNSKGQHRFSVNFKTMQQPTILVTFFQIRGYNQDYRHRNSLIFLQLQYCFHYYCY